MERNRERFVFLKWGATAFRNMLIVPPGSGIVHQVNLEYLARVVFCDEEEGGSEYRIHVYCTWQRNYCTLTVWSARIRTRP